ncbi:uncharacterized protein BDR25DRAFT_395495, partial [Lindgomyces ingoldianus]
MTIHLLILSVQLSFVLRQPCLISNSLVIAAVGPLRCFDTSYTHSRKRPTTTPLKRCNTKSRFSTRRRSPHQCAVCRIPSSRNLGRASTIELIASSGVLTSRLTEQLPRCRHFLSWQATARNARARRLRRPIDGRPALGAGATKHIEPWTLTLPK